MMIHVELLHSYYALLSFQLRRQARLRREYLYRKSIEERERTTQERKRKIQDAIDGRGGLTGCVW